GPPFPPKRSERSGEAVALLYNATTVNATTINDATGTTRRARGSGRRYLRRGSDRAGPDAWRAPAASRARARRAAPSAPTARRAWRTDADRRARRRAAAHRRIPRSPCGAWDRR